MDDIGWRLMDNMLNELVEQGHHRLAFLLGQLSELVVNNQHEQVDVLVPEALALVRPLKSPSLEIYIRKWHLESRVWKRFEGRSALSEAVSLMEFAHRPENRDGPFTLDTVYELVGCYSVIDGPGYATERQKAIEEVFSNSQLLSDRSMFDCFSGHYASALMDQNRYEDAYAFLTEKTRFVQQQRFSIWEFPNVTQYTIRCLTLLGRFQEALEMAHSFQKHMSNDQSRWTRIQIYKAGILARMARYQESMNALPSLDTIAPNPGYYKLWSEVVEILVLADAMPNTWKLSFSLQAFVERLQKSGAVRPAIELALVHAELGIHRGGLFAVKWALDVVASLVPSLAKPLEIPQKLQALQAKLEAQRVLNEVPLADENVEEMLDEDRLPEDPEKAWALIEKALSIWPHRESFVTSGATRLLEMGFLDRAERLLRSFLEHHPPTEDVVLALGRVLTQKNDGAALLSLCQDLVDHVQTDLQSAARFVRGVYLHKIGSWEKSNEDLYRLLALQPDAVRTRKFLAQNELCLKHWDRALQLTNEAISLEIEPSGMDWWRMEAASILGDWPAVRASCARLQIPLDTDHGPIEEKWHHVRVQFSEDPDEPVYHALRTGPVTARVVEVAHPDKKQHVSDWVVFSSVPLNEPPKENDPEHTHLFSVRAILEPANQLGFDIDGVHPGEAILEKLVEDFTECGGLLQVRSKSEYEINVGDDSLPGLYAFVAVPSTIDLSAIPRLIENRMADQAHPLVYLRLARMLSDSQLILQQEERMVKYNLSLD